MSDTATLLGLARTIWSGRPRLPLPHAALVLTVVVGDITRQARTVQEGGPADRAELAKEYGNLILTTARAAHDQGLDLDECIALAAATQRRYVATLETGARPGSSG